MKKCNPVRDLGLTEWIVEREGDESMRVLVSGFLPNGHTCYIWDGYSDLVIAKAGGYGYDKESAALAEAIATIYKIEMRTGAAGVQEVIKEARSHNINIISMRDEAMSNFTFSK